MRHGVVTNPHAIQPERSWGRPRRSFASTIGERASTLAGAGAPSPIQINSAAQMTISVVSTIEPRGAGPARTLDEGNRAARRATLSRREGEPRRGWRRGGKLSGTASGWTRRPPAEESRVTCGTTPFARSASAATAAPEFRR